MAFGPVALALALVALVLGPLLAVLAQGTGAGLLPADWAALRFTVAQAGISAVLSVSLAVPVARALFRRRFPGRGALVVLMGAPFLLPAIVAALGLVAVLGRGGPMAAVAGWLHLPPPDPFGAHGVVLAHVFLNLPLAVRLLLQGWQDIPPERLRLAVSLGLGPRGIGRHLEAPMLRAVVPGALAAVFAICLTSFAIALVLGGGPAATTVELAIYQAIRFDFDLARAAMLALVQLAIGAAAAWAAWRLWRPAGLGAGRGAAAPAWLAPGGWRRWSDGAWIGGAGLFLVLPLGAVVLAGLPGLADLPDAVWPALLRSVAIAVPSAVLTAGLALVLALAAARGSRLADLAAVLPLAVSALVLGTGLFLLLRPVVAPPAVALPVTLTVNVLLSLPFAYRVLLPAAATLRADYGRLAESLSLRGWQALRVLVLPRLARPLGFGAGLAGALAMGDLGVIALFAAEREATLPLVIQRLMGAYRMDAAAAAALLLVLATMAVFVAFDRWGSRAAD
jgi:thiamine transport system permease protein